MKTTKNRYIEILYDLNKPLSTKELNFEAKKLGFAEKTPLGMAQEVYRLVKEGKLIKFGGGMYGLPYWEKLGTGQFQVGKGEIYCTVFNKHSVDEVMEGEFNKLKSRITELENKLLKIQEVLNG